MTLNVNGNIGVNNINTGKYAAEQSELKETNNSIFSGYETGKTYESDYINLNNTEKAIEPEQNVEELRAEYEEIKKEQGFAGKSWDWMKNKLPFLSKIGCNGSEKIEKIIAQAERGEISTEEAEEAIEKYKKNQEIGTEIALDAGTAVVVGAALLLAGPLGWGAAAVVGAGVAAGAASRMVLGAVEAGTNEVKGDYSFKDAMIDGVKGAIIGFAKAAGKIQGCIIPKPAKKVKDTAEKVVDELGTTSPFHGIIITVPA